jgi:cytochrome-b5 reductase
MSRSTVSAHASRKWIWLATGVAVSGAGYLLYYGPGRKAVFEAKQPVSALKALSAPDALDPSAFRSFKLSDIKKYNHNTNIFTFAFDDPSAKFNGKTASCVVFKANITGKDVIRPYTPISRPNTIGQLEFVIKNYPQGTMSKYVHELKKGDKLEIKGPIPKYPYEANKFQNLALIAGGTGITPMIQMIEEVLFNPDDKTKVTLLFANSSLSDILLKQDLDKLAQKYPTRLKIYYTVSKLAEKKEKDSWKGETGHITADMLKKLLPIPTKKDDENLLVMVCGPPGFMKLLSGEKTKDQKQGELTGLLKDLGFTEKNVFKF